MSVRTNDTVVDCLRWTAAHAPQNGITLYGRHGDLASIRYPELLARARQFAVGLHLAGLAPGQRLGLYVPTSIDFFVAYFGALMARVVPVTLPVPAFGKRLNYREALRLESIVRDARPACLLEGGGLDAGEAVPADQRRAGFDDILARGAQDTASSIELPRETLDDPALVQYTSGSILSPRGVLLTERNVSLNVQTIADLVGMNVSDTIDLWIPMFHDMGLMGSLTTIASTANLRICAPSVFLADALGWLRRFADAGSTINPSPHFFFRMLIEEYDAERAQGLDLRRWRVAFNGAEMIHPHELERFQALYGPHGFPESTMYPVYGLAESTLALAFPTYGAPPRVVRGDDVFGAAAPPHLRQRRFVSVGKPLPGHEIRIRPLSEGERGGGELAAEVGEILARGPCIMQGYVSDGELVSPFVDGWLPTRDLGFWHQGELFITGRMDEVIVARGLNYFPDDIEMLVGRTRFADGVELVARAAFRLDDGAQGSVALAVELKKLPADIDDRIRHLEGELLRELGFQVHVVCLQQRSIPRTTSGKLKRLALPGLLARGELTDKIQATGRGFPLPGAIPA
jgi:acyl-CoA synthetase (AMP-forming)/AMP-acid ligase II